MATDGVFSLVDIIDEGCEGIRTSRIGTLHRGIAKIDEFIKAPIAAVRTGDAHCDCLSV
jgi:hypothetical protein